MVKNYAKVIVKGSPITKSNFKLFNTNGRAILPSNTGKYHDRYAIYEEQIAYEARAQNPNIIFEEALIAILKVYYKSEKRHPDTNNITKSIFDGIEKSGLIINDAQVRRIIIEEFYDKENPRFELELFSESSYEINYSVNPREKEIEKVLYDLPANKKELPKKKEKKTSNSEVIICDICSKIIKNNDYITANKGTTKICKKCLRKGM